MITFDEAVALVTGGMRPLATERVSLAAADGRVLAEPVVAEVRSPPADVSSMDGYAVGALTGSTTLRMVGEAFAGAEAGRPIGPGEAVRIFTGAPLPPGAERVVIQENARRDGDLVTIVEPGEGTNIRRAGSDFGIGETLVKAGTLLGPRAIVAAAAADLAELTVFRRPRVRMIATGDELAEPGTARTRPGSIPESVSYGVAALARTWGAEVLGGVRLRDDLDAMRPAARAALVGADLLVVTGGASVGDRDFARPMFGEGLELVFSKVRIKPGKPVWLGRVGETLVLGLPGNPTSAMVTARLFLAPLLCAMNGRHPDAALDWAPVPLAEPLGPAGDRETFSRARVEEGRLVLLESQDSGAQLTLVAADLLARRPAGDRTYAAGEPLDTLAF